MDVDGSRGTGRQDGGGGGGGSALREAHVQVDGGPGGSHLHGVFSHLYAAAGRRRVTGREETGNVFNKAGF